jgi:hypothetical protein
MLPDRQRAPAHPVVCRAIAAALTIAFVLRAKISLAFGDEGIAPTVQAGGGASDRFHARLSALGGVVGVV